MLQFAQKHLPSLLHPAKNTPRSNSALLSCSRAPGIFVSLWCKEKQQGRFVISAVEWSCRFPHASSCLEARLPKTVTEIPLLRQLPTSPLSPYAPSEASDDMSGATSDKLRPGRLVRHSLLISSKLEGPVWQPALPALLFGLYFFAVGDFTFVDA